MKDQLNGLLKELSLFLTDTHGRDHITHAELAVTNDGKFLGFKNETIANLGAYARVFGTVTPTYLFGPCATGVYVMPAAYSNVKAVYTIQLPLMLTEEREDLRLHTLLKE